MKEISTGPPGLTRVDNIKMNSREGRYELDWTVVAELLPTVTALYCHLFMWVISATRYSTVFIPKSH
jgi:hypothetical protein